MWCAPSVGLHEVCVVFNSSDETTSGLLLQVEDCRFIKQLCGADIVAANVPAVKGPPVAHRKVELVHDYDGILIRRDPSCCQVSAY